MADRQSPEVLCAVEQADRFLRDLLRRHPVTGPVPLRDPDRHPEDQPGGHEWILRGQLAGFDHPLDRLSPDALVVMAPPPPLAVCVARQPAAPEKDKQVLAHLDRCVDLEAHQVPQGLLGRQALGLGDLASAPVEPLGQVVEQDPEQRLLRGHRAIERRARHVDLLGRALDRDRLYPPLDEQPLDRLDQLLAVDRPRRAPALSRCFRFLGGIGRRRLADPPTTVVVSPGGFETHSCIIRAAPEPALYI